MKGDKTVVVCFNLIVRIGESMAIIINNTVTCGLVLATCNPWLNKFYSANHIHVFLSIFFRFQGEKSNESKYTGRF